MKEYISLLKSHPVLFRLSSIQLISYFGAWFSNVAIYTLLLEMDVSAQVVAFVAMLHFLAGVIQAPFSGVIIDRLNPKKLMLSLITVEIITTICLIFITELSDLWLLYVLILIKMAAASFYFTTEMSLLPKLLDGDKLQKANEIHSIIWSLSYTLGMAISGFVVYILGVKVAFILDGFMFVIAFYLLLTLEINVAKNLVKEKFLRMMLDTFYYLRRTPKAFYLIIVHAFVGFTAFDALVALMVDYYYASVIATSLALGLIHSARAVGLVIGPMIFGKWINNKRIIYLFIGQGLAIWLWAYMMHNFYLSLVASVVAYNDMMFLGTAAFTSYMIGLLATHDYSLESIAVIMGTAFMVGGLYYAWVIRHEKLEEVS